jgi:sugar phosphate permease
MAPPDGSRRHVRDQHSASGTYRWAVLVAATVAQASSSLPMQGLGVLAEQFRADLGLNDAQIGLMVTVAGAAPILALFAVGHLLDRYDERFIVGAGSLISAAGVALAAAFRLYLLVLVGLFIFGLGYSTAQPGGSKLVAEWFPRRQRGTAMGIRQAGLPIGGALAALALPAAARHGEWQLGLWIAAIVVLAGGLVFVVFYRRAPHMPPASPRQPLLPRIAGQLRQPAMPPIILTGFTLVGTQYAVTTYFVLFTRDRWHTPMATAASMYFAAQVAGAIGRIALAAASDRPGLTRLSWVRLCMLATAVLAATLPFLPARADAIEFTAAALLGFVSYGWYGPWVAHVTETGAADSTGLRLGSAMAVNQIAIVGAPPLLGLLADVAGYPTMWWAITLVLITFSLLARPALTTSVLGWRGR